MKPTRFPRISLFRLAAWLRFRFWKSPLLKKIFGADRSRGADCWRPFRPRRFLYAITGLKPCALCGRAFSPQRPGVRPGCDHAVLQGWVAAVLLPARTDDDGRSYRRAALQGCVAAMLLPARTDDDGRSYRRAALRGCVAAVLLPVRTDDDGRSYRRAAPRGCVAAMLLLVRTDDDGRSYRRAALRGWVAAMLLLICVAQRGALAQAAAAADTSGASPAGGTVLMPEVEVVEKLNEARDSIVPSLGATSYSMPETQIEVQSQGGNAPINQTILRAPGAAEDSFGQLHVRGEHNNLQFRIDGILLPEGITGFGMELDSRFIRSVDLIDGALPAQFGFKTAGIIDIHTKEGADFPGGTVSFYGGSNSHIEPSFQYGGVDGKWTWYLEGDFTHDTLGIENPTGSDDAIHDVTNQYRGFGYLSYIIDDSSRLSFFGGASYQDYQIPDNPGQTPMDDYEGTTNFNSSLLDENQHQQNSYGVLAYQKSFDDFTIQAALFERYSTVLFTPDTEGDLIFKGLAGTENHSLNSQGIQIDSSYELNEHHTLRSGLYVDSGEQHAADPLDVFPADAAGNQTGDAPFTIYQHDYKAGGLYGVYLQDEWKILPALTLNYGGRFDVVDQFDHQNQLSPRANLTLEATSSTTLHAGYAKYFTPPSFEAVSRRDVAATNDTTNAFPIQRDDPVRAERGDYFDAGATQRIGADFKVGLDGYYKEAENQIDSGQFGAAIIETEFNYKKGNVYGMELTASYDHDGFSAYGNLALSRAEGTDIDSQQFQFDPAELAYIKNHWIYLDHNQAVTASAGVSYKWRDTTVYADFLYGNGLRAGFANEQKLPPYYPLNVGITRKISLSQTMSFKLRFDIVNITDQVYELRSGTGVGVGAPQYGPRRAFYGGVGFDF